MVLITHLSGTQFYLVSALVRLLLLNTIAKSNQIRKQFISVYSLYSVKSGQDCRQELKQRPAKIAANGFLSHSLFSLLSYVTQGHSPSCGTHCVLWDDKPTHIRP